jgi:DNA-binding CsgD family transcriptional regulator
MFSYDYIVLFVGFSVSLVVLGLTLARRNSVKKTVLREALAINGLYTTYVLILLVLNYVKYYQNSENAFWQTTEVWCLAIASVAFLGWRIPYLLSSMDERQPSPLARRILAAGMAASMVMLLAGCLFLRESESFELLTAAGPATYFVVSTSLSLIYAIRSLIRRKTIGRHALLILPVFVLLLTVTQDAVGSLVPSVLFPYAMALFQVSQVVYMRFAGRRTDQVEIDLFLTGLTRDYGISRRESELIELLLQGLSRTEIAERLYISPNTVKTHTANIYRKIGITSRNELFARFHGTHPRNTPDG